MSGLYIPNIQIPQAVPIDVMGAMQRGQQFRGNALAMLAQQRRLEQDQQQQNALAMYAGGLAAEDPGKRMNTLQALLRDAPGMSGQLLPLIQTERENAPIAGIMRDAFGGGAPAAPVAPSGGLMASLARAESGGNDAARNPNSTAAGRFQITDGTWRQYAPRLGLTDAQRMDPAAQQRVAEAIQADGSRALGRPLQGWEQYGAHVLGLGGLRAFANADPNANAYEVYVRAAGQNIADQAFRNNPGLLEPNMTIAQAREALARRTGGGGGGENGGAPGGTSPRAQQAQVAIDRLMQIGTPAALQRAAQIAQITRQETSTEVVPVPDPTSRTGFRYRRRALVDGAESPAPEGYRPNQQAFGGGENGLAMQQIETLAPRIRSGQATPDEVRRYQSAVTIAQTERVLADGTRIIPRLPPYAVGLDELPRLYPNLSGAPQPAAQAAPAPPAGGAPPAAAPVEVVPPVAPPGGVPVGATGMRADPPPPPGAQGGVIRAPRDVPQPIANAMLENVAGLNRARQALQLATQRPESFGFWRGVQNQLPLDGINRIDPDGAAARAAAADIGSLRIHDRSGAAVTAAEFPRLRPFIPQVGDDPRTVAVKLQRFVQEYEAVLRDLQGAYGPQQGYRPMAPVEHALRPPAQGGAGGQGGPRPDPLGMRR